MIVYPFSAKKAIPRRGKTGKICVNLPAGRGACAIMEARGGEDVNKWDDRFMEMAYLIASWASCYKENRKIGCVIVKNKRIMTTGYNGAPAGVRTCVERGECLREKLGIPSGTKQEICYATHAEQNAIIQAARLGVSIDGATLYCTHQPCGICAKMIVNAGIARVVYNEGYPDAFAVEMLNEGGVKLEKYDGAFKR
mgnify:CR=1 FL=1